MIDAQKPHVLALQEIGSESALGELQAALTTPMPHRAVAAPDDRGIRVGFISRRVLHDPLQIRPFPGGLLPVQVGDDPPGPDGPRTMNLMGRAALQVTVRANGRDVHLVNAHLKSKLLTFPGGFSPGRRGSARPLRGLRALPARLGGNHAPHPPRRAARRRRPRPSR